MAGLVAVGLDGSGESRAAADWAAREAVRRGLPLRLVHAWEWPPRGVAGLAADETAAGWGRRMLDDAQARLHERHPELDVETRQISDAPVEVLLRAAVRAELLVLGSRGASGFAGFLVGSVGLATVARASCPVVLVRAGPERSGRHAGGDGRGSAVPGLDVGRPSAVADQGAVVVGLDVGRPCDELIAFAFDAAARRSASLLALNVWQPPLPFAHPRSSLPARDEAERALLAVLRPWHEKFPEIRLTAQVVSGNAAARLLSATSGAALLAVGRRRHRPPLGTRLGAVAHAVIHHAVCPVAVIPHN
ncbi:universal stress protein [Streptomyces sp. NPDC051940]|uniref:universal stress protein n=1 Tax=Streptomyces sp. NPDC051940 TaxID=3155675 RepID=UPI003444DA67